jgi:hypothetical protein
MKTTRLRHTLLFVFFVFPFLSNFCLAQGNNGSPVMRLTVIDPYAEVRTGPGRGYPVFYAIEQGETIEVITRRPGWFEVRASSGQTGWTSTAELSRTMQASGEPADLPTVSYGDYLSRSWRAGLKTGQFIKGELDGADMFSATAGYRLLSWLGAEIELGKFFRNDARGRFYGFNLAAEPFTRWRVSPFVTYGIGDLNVDEQPIVLPLNIDKSSYDTYSAGVNYYIGRNFLVKGVYRWYTVDTDINTERVEAWNIGFNAFF